MLSISLGQRCLSYHGNSTEGWEGRVFNILQWNCRSLCANWVELQLPIRRFQPLCICLQETMVGATRTPPPTGYQAIYYPRDPAKGCHGSFAVFISTAQGVPLSVLNINSPLEVVAGRLHIHRFYTVCSLYLQPVQMWKGKTSPFSDSSSLLF